MPRSKPNPLLAGTGSPLPEWWQGVAGRASRAKSDPMGFLADVLAQTYGYGSIDEMRLGPGNRMVQPSGLPAGFGGVGMLSRDSNDLITAIINETAPKITGDTVRGYRALRMFPSRPDAVFPAMIRPGDIANAPAVKPGEVMVAGFFPGQARKKQIVPRFGIHGSPIPFARQFDVAGPGGSKSNKLRDAGDMVWTEAEFPLGANYQDMVMRMIEGSKAPKGRGAMGPNKPVNAQEWMMNPGKAPTIPFGQQLPSSLDVPFYLNPRGGSYSYSPNNSSRMAGNEWLVGDLARHTRLLSDEEVRDIVASARPDLVDLIKPRAEYRQGGKIIRPDAQGWTEQMLRELFPSWY